MEGMKEWLSHASTCEEFLVRTYVRGTPTHDTVAQPLATTIAGTKEAREMNFVQQTRAAPHRPTPLRGTLDL